MQTAWFKRDELDKTAYKCMRYVAFVDFLFATIALLIAQKIKILLLPENVTSVQWQLFYILSGGVLLVFILQMLSAYQRVVLLRLRRSFPIVFQGCLTWLLVFPVINLLLNTTAHLSRSFYLGGFLVMLTFVMLGRIISIKTLRTFGVTQAFKQKLLFVDWSERMEKLYKRMNGDPWHPYEVVGICPPKGDVYTKTPPEELKKLNSYEELEGYLEKRPAHILLLADTGRPRNEIEELYFMCERCLVAYMMISGSFQTLLSGLQVLSISGVPVLGVSNLPLQKPYNRFLKRTIDVIGSVFGILLFGPFIALFCLLVYLEEPGPIFYKQRRVGRNGAPFDIIKIRSMRINAEENSGAVWAKQDDNRRLKIGAFMRRWNIDELPQFLNVLSGDMSLVGPRPERPELIVMFKETIEHYNARHSIIPGMTGWAQVNGLRGDTDLSERIRYDIFYIENWSLGLDFQIMLMTFVRWEGAA
jgi:exopolysaccharide biosynthesis polyprenyl glycosylphosphotransferase